jgi:hypothetical protein
MKFKFEIHQTVWYMLDNKVHGAPILSRMIVENYFTDEEVCTDSQRSSFQTFGKECVKYATTHSVLDENQLFTSKEELLSSL